MTPDDTVDLLSAVAAFDRRTVGQADVVAWHAALSDLPLDACQQAIVKHYAGSTDWVMPAHVRRLVLAAGNDRAMRALPHRDGDLRPKPFWFDAAAAAFKRGDKAEGERIIREGRAAA